MLDYDRIPEWQSAVRTARVLERDGEGRGVVVAYEVDVRVADVRYTLRHHYEEPTLIRSTYVEGDFRDCHGEWTFADRGDGSDRRMLRPGGRSRPRDPRAGPADDEPAGDARRDRRSPAPLRRAARTPRSGGLNLGDPVATVATESPRNA